MHLAAQPHTLMQCLVKELFESSSSLIAPMITPQEVQPKVHSECTLRVHQKNPFQSEDIYMTFLMVLASWLHILVQLYLKVFSENSSQTSKPWVHLGCIGCTEDAFSGCTKAESHRTRCNVLSKTKTCKMITGFFHFYATCFILLFLLRTFFKTFTELLHLITLHPKLILWGALKKALVVLEDRSCQTQYCSLQLQRYISYLFLTSFEGII